MNVERNFTWHINEVIILWAKRLQSTIVVICLPCLSKIHSQRIPEYTKLSSITLPKLYTHQECLQSTRILTLHLKYFQQQIRCEPYYNSPVNVDVLGSWVQKVSADSVVISNPMILTWNLFQKAECIDFNKLNPLQFSTIHIKILLTRSKILLLRSDSLLHALVRIAQSVTGLLQKTTSSILGLSCLIGCGLCGIRRSLLSLLPFLPCDIASFIGLILSGSRRIGGGLLRVLPLLPSDITSLVGLVSCGSCYLVSLVLGGSSGILLKKTFKKGILPLPRLPTAGLTFNHKGQPFTHITSSLISVVLYDSRSHYHVKNLKHRLLKTLQGTRNRDILATWNDLLPIAAACFHIKNHPQYNLEYVIPYKSIEHNILLYR